MPKRNTLQRRHSILETLNLEGQVQVDALAKALDTSEVTNKKAAKARTKKGENTPQI